MSAEVKLMYLDTLCRYNCKDEDYYRTPVARYFMAEEQDHWKLVIISGENILCWNVFTFL